MLLRSPCLRTVGLSLLALKQSTGLGTAAAAMSTASANMFALTNNGVPQTDSVPDAKGMLSAYPRGAYTTARTVNVASVFEFEAHVERMAQSADLMLAEQQSSQAQACADLVDAKKLRPLLAASFRGCIREFLSKYPDYKGELKLTVLADWQEADSEQFALFCHGVPLPPVPRPPVICEVRGEPRRNALAKDSQWITERKALEDLKRPEHNEIILPTADGLLLEVSSADSIVYLLAARLHSDKQLHNIIIACSTSIKNCCMQVT
jgi:Amino-transferase class IV